MAVSFEKIKIGNRYSRNDLAKLWGYASFHPLARGVVTPRGDHKIILFVTFKKTQAMEPYKDALRGDTLYWEGPTDHFAEPRMVETSDRSEDQIFVFCRENPYDDFRYEGKFVVRRYTPFINKPSEFILKRL